MGSLASVSMLSCAFVTRHAINKRMVYESGFSRETEMVGCIHIVKILLGVDHVIMEADESKVSFTLRGESPSSPASPCFPGWAVILCLEVVAEEMLPKLASAEVSLWETLLRLLHHRLRKPPTSAPSPGSVR